MPRARPRWLVDLGLAATLAVVLAVGAVAAAAPQAGRSRPLDAWAIALIALAALAAVAPRRIAPLWALTGSMVVVSAYLLLGYPYGPIQLCMVIAMFEVARQRPLRTSLPACGLAALVASGTLLARLVPEVDTPALLGLAWAGWIVLPWSLGALVQVLAAARERARRDLVTRVALDERTRLAGEVHDVAGHGFAVVAMHAGVALRVFDEQPDQVRRSLEAIKEASDSSLTALRGMLHTVHPCEVDESLRGLVDRVRAGGLQVELDAEDVLLPGHLDAVVYRVVRESLTNVVRHAGAARAEVRIAREGNELLVQVLDDGRGSPGPEGGGLCGMRRRVEAVAGRFEAGPREGGGFRVAARVPLPGGGR